MVTTRGRRGSSTLEEPQVLTPRKKQAKEAQHRDPAQKNHPDDVSTAKLRKRHSGAPDVLSSSSSRSPENKRIKRETTSSSPELRKSTRTPSPLTTRKGRNRGDDSIEDATMQATILEQSADTHALDNTKEQLSTENVAITESVVPSSVLSQQSELDKLSLAEQFRLLLAQNPIPDLEIHQQQSIVNQIVQWWETSGKQTSEVKPDATVVDVSTELRNAAIPVLLSVATQALHVFAYYKVEDICRMMSDADSKQGIVYSVYQNLFRIVKNLYPSKNGFICASGSSKEVPESVKAFDTANRATFFSSCFGAKEIGFYTLNGSFFEIFNDESPSALQKLMDIYRDLKTQAYISAVSNKERSKDLVLQEMFPEDLLTHICRAQPAISAILEGNTSIYTAVTERRIELQGFNVNESSIVELKLEYSYSHFLNNLANYLHDQFENITGQSLIQIAPLDDRVQGKSHDTTGKANADESNGQILEELEFRPNYGHPDPPEPPPAPKPDHASIDEVPMQIEIPSADDIIAQAAKAAQEALLGFSDSNTECIPAYDHSGYNQPPVQEAVHPQPHQNADIQSTNTFQAESNAPQPSLSAVSSQPAQYPTATTSTNSDTKQSYSEADPPYLQNHHQSQAQPQSYYQANSSYGPPGQSQPTAVLYERARQVANSKSSNVPRNKASNVSQRRPWTLEEEQALMDGLDQVKGPHWSQILVLYGPGGSINETLRDRTQVQLKDKARNLKLFFLKSKIEVPYYLSFVTGELKSRAPSHVSTFDDTPPRSVLPPNGLSGTHGANLANSAARTRVMPSPANSLYNTIFQIPQSSSTYSSPYAAIPPPKSAAEAASAQQREQADSNDADEQNVADLASSAAAQVAAALANFNALDLPGFDMSTITNSIAEPNSEEIVEVNNPFTNGTSTSNSNKNERNEDELDPMNVDV